MQQDLLPQQLSESTPHAGALQELYVHPVQQGNHQ
ncbi:unnamed protein product [Soboliphyme baturini]|uniref:Uncharacterized protein n=1 Tax=Soboliphyme baturini TaxID=241478 RepID=A0A183ICD1_9BILA|nr:unnamed protein product [Soboliphyme baturini]